MVFTRKEKGLLYDPYFAVIRETEQFIEVRSLNTGHCWNVFKNTIESGKKVTLYEQTAELTEYDEQLVRRLIENIIIRTDGTYKIEFKSGTTIELQ